MGEAERQSHQAKLNAGHLMTAYSMLLYVQRERDRYRERQRQLEYATCPVRGELAYNFLTN